MAINLKKGSSFNLTKNEPSLKKVMVGLGWELPPNEAFDLDASAFLLNSSGKLVSESHFIFYNNLKSPDGSIAHTGDNRTGKGDEDDEMILVNLPIISDNISEILFTASIHDAISRNQTFGRLSNAYIRLVDVETSREILKFDLDNEFGQFTDVELGKLQKQSDGWHFVASGIGSTGGLEGYVNKYQ
jgi:tellurium resistance protein TerD